MKDKLAEKIRTKQARTAVIGLGYVGLPLAVELGSAGFSVTGIDNDTARVDRIAAGHADITDVEAEALRTLLQVRRLSATTDTSALSRCDTVSLCVPTPLRKTRDPDLSHILDATERLAEHLHPGMLIILESTTYPGTTEEVILDRLEKSGLRVGSDFFLCFSPERVDPGNPSYHTRNIPKVIGGVTPACTEVGALLYSQVMEEVVPVSSTRVAEMVKLLENTFRMINIGLANEMALLCDRMKIDVWEVIDAAATKPFGFMPFYPGPGLGGHCIPVDPHYLSWKTRQAGQEARFIDLAAQINGSMPQFVVEKIQTALNDRGKPVKGSRIHVMGVAYKRDVADVRESPALDILALLSERGAVLSYTDPFVAQVDLDSLRLASQPQQAAALADCVVIVADHSIIDYDKLLEDACLIVDTRNRLKSIPDEKIVRL